MKKILPFFLFFFFLASPVFADDFSDSGDISQNSFYSTISYALGEELPEKIVVENGVITYSPFDVVATSSYELFDIDVASLFQDSVKRRINSKGTYIALPPGMTVDVLYHYWNESSHPINIQEIAVAYSRGHISFLGYLTEFGNFTSEEFSLEPINLYSSGKWFTRKGIFRRYSGLEDIPVDAKGSFVLDRFHIKLPLEISKPEVKGIEGGVEITVLVKNTTSYPYNGISFEHGSFKEILNLQGKQEYLVKYQLSGEFEDGDLGSFVIKDNNVARKCTVLGNNFSNTFSVESISVFSKREDGGWVAGGSMGPSQESFCMQRNPYIFTSENIRIERESEEELMIDDVESEEVEEKEDIKTEKEGVVLGVTDTLVELPKTGNIDFSILTCGVMLLVVDLFLWYSVLRKKKYESNYSFTKLCTKSSKDSHKRGV
ncbi:MAG: hypothetical protein ACOX0R_03085 [Candidatus Dojkabacteria bacterium]